MYDAVCNILLTLLLAGPTTPASQPSAAREASTMRHLLSRLDLDRPGLQAVKRTAGQPQAEAAALLAYYRTQSPFRHTVDRSQRSQLAGRYATPRDMQIADDALRHVLLASPNYPPHGATLDLDDMIAAVDRIDQGETLSSAHRRFLLRGSSIGGALPKAPILFEGRRWIAKFGREREAWNTCRIEHANLRLAARCGIHVPESRTLMVGDRDVFLIERFDRDPSGDPIPFISAATLLATDAITTGSYQDIAVEMRRHIAAPAVAEDLKQLFMRMVFNILCNNADDHLRNHGFIYQSGQGWRLSPAYDVVPQPDMGPGVPRDLTLGVGLDGNRRATLANALTVSPVFGLSPEDGRQIIDHLTQAFVSQWQSVYACFGVSEKDMPFLLEAFVNHLPTRSS